MEQKKPDFDKIGRADLACRTAQRLAYQWQTSSPGWRLSFVPSADLDSLLVTLHRTDQDRPSGTESIPVEELDWRLPDADIYRQITMAGSRLLGAWIRSQEQTLAHAPAGSQVRR